MKYAFIDAEKTSYTVAFMCRQLRVSRSGYHAWVKRPASRRAQQDKVLALEVASIFEENKHRYGSPRVHREMRARGRSVGRKRVVRLMQAQGLAARRRARFVRTTDSNHTHPVAPNVLDRKFSPSEPLATWAGDITYVWTAAGWVYLAVLLDLFSRKVVGWALSTRIDTELVLAALGQGLHGRDDVQGLLFHSDRGSQYASGDYQQALKARGIACSMSRKGNCWDNAVVESFFATLKKELIYTQSWTDKAVLERALFEYIEVFYNRKRRHSALGYVSPAEYERANEGLSHAA